MSEWIAESVVQALRLLPDDLVADRADRYAGGVDELAECIRACADGVVASLDGRITVEERVLVVAATLTTGGTGAGVYTETRAAVKRFTELRERWRSCPGLDVALLLRAPADFDGAALARLAVTAQAKPLLVEQPGEPWRLIIAAAALSKPDSDPKSLADAAVDTVRKAGTLTARYIAEQPDSRLQKSVFDQPGDAVFAIDTVAMRLVLDGRLDTEPTRIAELLPQLVTKSRANFTKPATHGQDVDLDHGVITIDPDIGALHESAHQLWLGPPKTPASARTITLPPFLVGLLRDHLAHSSNSFVFTTRHGHPLWRSTFDRRVFRPAVDGNHRKATQPIQPGLTFHGLRHSHKT